MDWVYVKNFPGDPLEEKRNPLIERPTAFQSIVRWYIPSLKVSELEKVVVNILATMEKRKNATVKALENLQVEV